tara:strand:- start:379 stop:627 length:249 start_codon:yes stop_codon:yes gene_type:complete
MPFKCFFCQSTNASAGTGYFNHYGLCDKCKTIQKLSDLYGIDTLVNSLETIYVRDKEPIEQRVEAIKLRSGKKVSYAEKTKL